MYHNGFYHESPNLSRQSAIIILLLSLLLNMGLLILICSIITSSRNDSIMMKEQLHDAWKSPSNPAQVIVHNPLVSLSASASSTPTTPSLQSTPSTWASMSNNSLQSSTISSPSDTDTDKTKEETKNNTHEMIDTTQSDESPDAQEDTSSESERDTHTLAEQESTIASSDPVEPATKSSTYMPKKQRTLQRSKRNQSRAPHYQAQRDRFTLNQLVNGFLGQPTSQAKQPSSPGFGSRAIMEGTGYGVPTKEQLVYERYIQRIVHCMRNAYAYSRADMPSLTNPPSPVSVGFTLDEQGKMISLTIVNSSNNRALDTFVLHVFREASMSFPPIPASIYKSPFNLQCIDALMIMHHQDAQLIIK